MQTCHHIETSELISSANQLTGFYMVTTLAFNELKSGDMQVVFINKCKSCEISNQMFFNVMFSMQCIAK